MADKTEIFAAQLKQACKLSGARWATWIKRNQSGWDYGSLNVLSQARQISLAEFIQDPATSAWLAGALSHGRTRSRKTGKFSASLGCPRVYVFANLAVHHAILVGADQLSKESQAFLRILALNDPFEESYPEIPVIDQTLIWPVESGLDLTYDPRNIFGLILDTIARVVPSDGAYLAIRVGDTFRVEVTRNYPPQVKGMVYRIGDNEILSRIVGTHQGVILSGRKALPTFVATPEPGKPARSSLCLPCSIGRRVIGLFIFVSSSPDGFTLSVLRTSSSYVERLAHGVENAIIFSEVARYLQQLAVLNELAAAASAGTGTDDVARVVVRRLRRAFRTDLAVVLMCSADRMVLREVGSETPDSPLTIPVPESLAGYVVEKGLPFRTGNVGDAPRFLDKGYRVRSYLGVPLKYRSRVIGAIVVESVESNAFTSQDEQLLIVIASHLAGLLENVRLNQEAWERAGNLSLIHKVLQRAVGLVDVEEIAQITAELMAEYFGYEYAVVLVPDEKDQTLVSLGVGGTRAETLPRGYRIPFQQGITGRVFLSGESYVSNNVTQNAGDFSIQCWQAGSQVCIPLREGEKVIGLINLERAQKNAFSESDLLILESLAGILSSVIMNARRHQELEQRIASQQLTEKHLVRSARLAAVGEMVAGVAHEINNPLTTVIGFVELALEELPMGLPQRAELELVLDEARRARGVVRRLLDFSRQGDNLRTQVDLNALVGEVLTLVQHVAQIGGVEIQVDYSSDLPRILIDSNQIKQVLLNLVQNALQAMPEGGKLCLRTVHHTREGLDGVAVLIKDTGEGILLENQDRIFDPFFTTRPVGTGTGLGLSVSYGIIVDHSGHIEVESQVGAGSCFTVWLPLKAGENDHA